MKNVKYLAFALALPVMGTSAHATETIRMTIAAGLPVHSTGVAYLENFLIPEVDKRLAETGDYQIEWTKGWGGTIAGQFDMFEAVEDGIVDMAYVNTLFEGAKLPLEQITFVTPFGSTDLKQTMATFDKVRGQIPELDEQFLKHNQRRLAISGLVNYHMVSTFEINSLDDLQGRKIGATVRCDEPAQGLGGHDGHLISPLVEIPGHFQVARGAEPHGERSVGLVRQLLIRMEKELAGDGGGAG